MVNVFKLPSGVNISYIRVDLRGTDSVIKDANGFFMKRGACTFMTYFYD